MGCFADENKEKTAPGLDIPLEPFVGFEEGGSREFKELVNLAEDSEFGKNSDTDLGGGEQHSPKPDATADVIDVIDLRSFLQLLSESYMSMPSSSSS